MKHFRGAIFIAMVGLVLAFYVGGVSTLYVVVLLAMLEVSLSFDNAVVNAKVLETMEPKWQERFITFGMPIAVFGMRFLFPIVIVAIASGLGIWETFTLALDNPEKYQETLGSVEKLIFAFGGSFLLMVFLSFIFDVDREDKWITIVEESDVLLTMGKVSSIQMIIAMAIGILLMSLSTQPSIGIAYFTGVLLYSLIESLDNILSSNGVRNGLMGLLYLEVLDASFSFDGVIGAFALSSDIFIIMIGLGIGAMFVRSLTLYFVKENTLDEFKYLEHGAHYAIFALAIVMFLKIFFHVNEIMVGTLGVLFIGASLLHSIIEKHKEKKLVKQLA